MSLRLVAVASIDKILPIFPLFANKSNREYAVEYAVLSESIKTQFRFLAISKSSLF